MLIMAAYTGLMIGTHSQSLFYTSLTSNAAAFFVIGPKKVSHSIYTSAQRLRSMPFGWAILIAFMSASTSGVYARRAYDLAQRLRAYLPVSTATHVGLAS